MGHSEDKKKHESLALIDLFFLSDLMLIQKALIRCKRIYVFIRTLERDNDANM